MKFFQPTEQFLDMLVKLAGPRPIIDCGCGEGHVTKALVERGANVLGLDIQAKGDGSTIVPCDTTTFHFPDHAIVLFCRPCHSDWVERTIKRAKLKADVILYIGLDKNYEDDLGQYAGNFEEIASDAGEAGESVWAMKGIAADVVTWCLIHPDYWQEPNWMESGDGWWINLSGGRMPKGKEKILETVVTDDWRQLDWKKTGLYQTSGNAGWLDPGGRMHYCDSKDHDQYADLILHSSSADLLDDGWCRVYGKYRSLHEPNFYCQETMTAEQRNYLQQHGYRGFQLDDEDEPPAMLSSGDGKEYPTTPSLLKRDRTSE